MERGFEESIIEDLEKRIFSGKKMKYFPDADYIEKIYNGFISDSIGIGKTYLEPFKLNVVFKEKRSEIATILSKEKTNILQTIAMLVDLDGPSHPILEQYKVFNGWITKYLKALTEDMDTYESSSSSSS